jgi:uncharacterized membrane-anchored protein YitT (DUF2179 family)
LDKAFRNFVLSPAAMGLRQKLNIMLHQISWFTYAVSIISLVILYYFYIGVAFYRAEIQSAIFKFSGKQPSLKTAGNSDLQIPDYEIMGKAQPEAVEFVAQEELAFGPSENPDEQISDKLPGLETSSRLIGNFSEMVSEVKTLIRVINESSESKENFEMLFRLIVQKYQALRGTPYQQQISDFLMSEGASEFPFSLDENDLENYWTEEIKN